MAKRFSVALDRTLYVGDETRDIEAAVDGGVAVAAVTWGYNDRGALAAARPTYLVEAFDELADLVTYHPPPRLTVVS
jgi:phosphoglycolate phosphatase